MKVNVERSPEYFPEKITIKSSADEELSHEEFMQQFTNQSMEFQGMENQLYQVKAELRSMIAVETPKIKEFREMMKQCEMFAQKDKLIESIKKLEPKIEKARKEILIMQKIAKQIKDKLDKTK
jgi:hypothetical protein